MKIEIENLTIEKAHKHLKNKDFSSRELTESYLARIEKKNPELNAYIEVFDDSLAQAENADVRLKEGGAHILTGIPIAIKDNILINGRFVTAGSRILAGHRAVYDALVVEKLKDHGSVFLGRSNLDEFAMGSSTEFSVYGPTKNPHDTSRVAGGSSGGSASAVAANIALGALGSDTGGSVRQPAGLCGIVGMKPTYGRVSRRGLIAMASSFDQIGTLAKTVSDAEILFNCISGYDPLDSTSIPDEKWNATKNKKTAKRVGIPYHIFNDGGVDKDVLVLFDRAISYLKENGYTVEDIELPNLKYSLDVYYIVMPAETSTNLARFDGVRYGLKREGESLWQDYEKTRADGFGKEVQRRILLGAYVLSAGYHDAYYRKAIIVREIIKKEVENIFERVDLIALPTSPTPAFKIGERIKDPLSMYLSDIFTVPANITGCPSISIPVGTVARDEKKLPIGFQFMAPCFMESSLFVAGKELEKII